MRLNVLALACAAGLVWGGGVLIVAVAHAVWPDYGGAFLEVIASIYPGYQITPGLGSIVSGTLYALVDGAVCGALLALLYNLGLRLTGREAA